MVVRLSGLSLVAVFAAALIVASCGAGLVGTTTLPTHKDLNGYPAALLDATLVRDGPCLRAAAADGTERWLPIWPAGFSLAGDVMMNGGQHIVSVGDRVKLGGGEYDETDYAFLRTLMNDEVPAACRGGKYWLVGQIVP